MLLSVIASDLDALNDSFRGLKDKVGKWVPCICDTCAGLKEPAMFAQKELIDRKQRGKSTIECPKPPYHNVSVVELLDGMNLEQWLEQASKKLPSDMGESEIPVRQSKFSQNNQTVMSQVNVAGSIVLGGRSSDRSTSDTKQPTTNGTRSVKTVRIFLASSAEVRKDRDAFDLYLRQQNDRLRKQGMYLEIVRWENFLDALSSTRLQDEYNKTVRNCDLFVSLFKTKTGKYTEEEFNVAHQTFNETGKPLIYTYFQKATVSTSASNRDALMSLWNFQKKLDELGHFYTEYESVDGLQRQFRDQLDKLRDDSLL